MTISESLLRRHYIGRRIEVDTGGGVYYHLTLRGVEDGRVAVQTSSGAIRILPISAVTLTSEMFNLHLLDTAADAR